MTIKTPKNTNETVARCTREARNGKGSEGLSYSLFL